ncbi:MAG TPA: sigma-70 family RNA polymerase sigma factor [Verrucomicrobiota bacterium]|nr:sigma-70 family RNA polymerase sigma factor [Verrucomicrobiota bacterium]
MSHLAPDDVASSHNEEDFTETRWTQVALAGSEDGSAAARDALEQLCARYWPSIYSYLRRRGKAPVEAEDLTQAFLADLIAKQAFSRADPSKGRFRNFLLGALRRFLVDGQRRTDAEKRGRNKVVLVGDFVEVEREYSEEAEPALGPDEVFDRRWAATILQAAYSELQAEFSRAGKEARFRELSRFLSDPGNGADYEVLAGKLGMSSRAVPAAVCRFRDRYRELVRQTVLATVAGAEQVNREFEDLFR